MNDTRNGGPDVLGAVQRIIAEVVGVDPTEVRPDAAVMRDIGADSLHMVEIAMKLEDEFGVTFDEDDQVGATVQEIAYYVEARRGEVAEIGRARL